MHTTLRLIGACTLLSMVTPGAGAADAWPVRPIRMIIPFPPGGSNDIIGRLLGQHLGERLGKPVVIDNRAGAGSNLGIGLAAKADPDGYTMLIISAAYAVAPSMYQKLPYDHLKSFAPVAKIGDGPYVLLVFPGLAAKTTKDLIALAKAKPGQLNFASPGVGTSVHLASELFRSMAQIDVVHIPFKGGSLAMVDVMSGNSQYQFSTIVQALPQFKAGKLRALGVATKQRVAALADVPTIDESGLPGYEASVWWGLMYPAGTPRAIVDRVDNELTAILQLPEVSRRFAADGAVPDHMNSPDFAKYIVAETLKWGRVAKQAGIKPQ